MKYKYQKLAAGLLLSALLLSGCSAEQTADTARTTSAAGEQEAAASELQAEEAAAAKVDTGEVKSNENSQNTDAEQETEAASGDEYFSSRDLSGEYDSSEAVEITLSGSSITASSDCVSIDGTAATIRAGGTYILSGSLEDGSIIVDVSKDEKVQLVLNGVGIHSDNYAAIYVKQCDKVFVTLAEGSENRLSNGGSFIQTDDTEVDAVVFSKDDLTLNGGGSLTLSSPAGHGIVGKDDVTITEGAYTITAGETAIRANDSLDIAGGSFCLTAASDGLHAENNDDDSLGSIYIAGGSFEIQAGDDGIHAVTTLTVDGGDFTIQAAEGLEATLVTINDGSFDISASDDGINAGKKSSQLGTPTITINGGDITIVMGAGDTDGVDANGDIVINGGTIDVTGTSTFDYDGTGTLNGGTVIVNGTQVTSLPTQNFGGMGGGRGGRGF